MARARPHALLGKIGAITEHAVGERARVDGGLLYWATAGDQHRPRKPQAAAEQAFQARSLMSGRTGAPDGSVTTFAAVSSPAGPMGTITKRLKRVLVAGYMMLAGLPTRRPEPPSDFSMVPATEVVVGSIRNACRSVNQRGPGAHRPQAEVSR